VGIVERRIGLLFAVFLAMLLVAGVRAGWLGVVKADALQEAAATQQVSDIVVPARRGAILDRNGVELAVSRPAVTIAATPYLVEDAAKTASRLARVLRLHDDDLLRQLARRDTGFVYLAHHVTPARARKVERMRIAGLEFIPEFKRHYPRSWMASQVLGTTGGEGHGLAGLEYLFDDDLAGQDGERRMVKDALGDPIELRDTTRAARGRSIRLTLDANLQDRAESVLAQVGRDWRPAGATAVAMDPRTGEILALANWPRVNANEPEAAPAEAMRNSATVVNYEPGSTFKAITVAAALEEKTVTPDTEWTLPPSIRVADRVISESHDRGYVTLTTRGILEQSSNVGAVKIGATLGARRFDHWVRRFGFDRRTAVDLPGEERGILLPLEKYSGSSMGNLPLGQGLAVTPIQMATAYAAIANGGILRPPHIVAQVGARKTPLPKGRRVISQATAASVRRMLEGVLGPGGTASGAHIDGYVLAGKTGTAEKPDEHGGYSKTKFVASFVGFAPARNPKLLVTVMVDEPQGDIYGGTIAAPAFKEITSFALNYLRIAPE
jgi:cell division protein FtsI/penicillin-binding protein 2